MKKISVIAFCLCCITKLFAQEFDITYQGEIEGERFILHLNTENQNADSFYMSLADYKPVNLKGEVRESGEIRLQDEKKSNSFTFIRKGRTIEGTYIPTRKKIVTIPFFAIDLRGEYMSTAMYDCWTGLYLILSENGYMLRKNSHKDQFPVSIRRENGNTYIYNEEAGFDIGVTDSTLIISNDQKHEWLFEYGRKCDSKFDKIYLSLAGNSDFISGESFVEFPEKDEDKIHYNMSAKLDSNYTIYVDKIRQSDYYLKLWQSGYRQEKYAAVTDAGKAKQMLKKRVEFYQKTAPDDPFFYAETAITRINFKDGNFKSFEDGDYPLFIAYYPDLDILVTEGGHSSDYCFDLRDSKKTDTSNPVGNPLDCYTSPDKQMRLSGYFDGQDCIAYFLEKWDKKSKSFKKTGEYFYNVSTCYSEGWAWTSNNTLIFKRHSMYGEYFEMRIVETR